MGTGHQSDEASCHHLFSVKHLLLVAPCASLPFSARNQVATVTRKLSELPVGSIKSYSW